MPLFHKDRVLGNTHPLNVVEVPDDFIASAEEVSRPPLYEVYMRMAEELAKRSTCARLQVGTVLTDARLEHVVALGYNGNARGFANRCDSDEAGRCGCIHSEMNALVKSPGEMRDKVAFATASPCVMCAKLMVQAHVSHLFYRTTYRDTTGLEVLDKADIVAVHYTRWKDLGRGG
jgi:dCMP deaminase